MSVATENAAVINKTVKRINLKLERKRIDKLAHEHKIDNLQRIYGVIPKYFNKHRKQVKSSKLQKQIDNMEKIINFEMDDYLKT